MFLRGLGYLPDEPDSRDFAFEALRLPKTPSPDVDLTPYVAEVLDQGQAGSCTAHGVSQALRMSLLRREPPAERHVPRLASRAALYFWARSYDQAEHEDSGAQIRNVFKSVRTMGYFPEEAWPYTDDTSEGSRLFQRPPLATDRLAIGQKPKSFSTEYRRIVSTGANRIMAIKQSHAEGRPVVFGCAVSEAFCRDDFDPQTALGPPVDVAGYHCMTTVGHITSPGGRTNVHVVNSWGIGFGIGGYFWMDESYALDWMDVWSVDCSEEASE